MSAQPSELSARIIDLFGNPATADPTKLFGNLTVLPSGLIQIGSSSGLILPDGYTTSLTPSGRNRIINGDMRIAQRAAAAYTNGVSGYSGPDRFQSNNGAGGGQYTQSLGSITFNGVARNAVVLTVNTAWSTFTTTNLWLGIQQRIEGTNCYDMLNGPGVISFLWNSNVSGTYSVQLYDATGGNSFVSTFTSVANTPQRVVIPVPTLPSTLGVVNNTAIGFLITIGCINAGTYATSSLNQWLTGNVITATGTTNWGATAANFIAVGELQFEPGLTNTPFERVNFGDQFLRCQRYYQTGQFVLQTTAASTATYNIVFSVPMRAVPTVGYTGVTYNNASSLTVNAPYVNSFNAQFGATAAAGYVGASWNAAAEL